MSRYVGLLLKTHLRFWYLYLIIAMVSPIIVLFSLFVGIGVEATTSSTDAATLTIIFLFGFLGSLLLFIPNIVVVRQLGGEHSVFSKVMMTAGNQLGSLCLFLFIGFVFLGY